MSDLEQDKGVFPWEEFPQIWSTESKFWSWVRGGLRGGLWNRHPVKLEYVKEKRIKVPLGKKTERNPEGLVWGGRCECCNNIFKQKDLQVDHNTPTGSLKGSKDLGSFVTKLIMVGLEDLSLLCKSCHSIKTYSERKGISFEEAVIAKKHIAFKKLTKKEKMEELGLRGTVPEESLTVKDLDEIWLEKEKDHQR